MKCDRSYNYFDCYLDMKIYIMLFAPMFFCVACDSKVQQQMESGDVSEAKSLEEISANQYLEHLASKIILDEVSLEKKSLSEGVVEINRLIDGAYNEEQVAMLGLDPDGFKLVNQSASKQEVTLKLANVSVLTLVKVIAEQAGVSYRYTNNGMALVDEVVDDIR